MTVVLPSRQGEAGLTLVEMLVALVLFALVGIASFAMLDAIIKTRDRTEGRLDGIVQLDRAVAIISRDLGQSLPDRSLANGLLTFDLIDAGGIIRVTYRVQDGTLWRGLQTDPTTAALDQRVITGVAAADWRMLAADDTWADTWPPPDGVTRNDGGPRAVELRLTLTGESERFLRRLVELPRSPAT
jgi:general secretion pathway protein J